MVRERVPAPHGPRACASDDRSIGKLSIERDITIAARTLEKSPAVPARIARRPGRTRRMGGRHGRAGDAPLDRASTAVGVWTRAVTSARLDRLHQLDGAIAVAKVCYRRK